MHLGYYGTDGTPDTYMQYNYISHDGSPHGLLLHSLMLKLFPFFLDVATVNKYFPSLTLF